jgi:hypothetical protein
MIDKKIKRFMRLRRMLESKRPKNMMRFLRRRKEYDRLWEDDSVWD